MAFLEDCIAFPLAVIADEITEGWGIMKKLEMMEWREKYAIRDITSSGFGVAKNLSNWAVKGKDFTVEASVESTVKKFHATKKPIGLCCISPVLAAKLIPGCELTVGYDTECEKWPYAKTAQAMADLGCKHINKHVNEIHVDKQNKLVTTSAFMCNAPIHEVFDGIGEMVKEVLKLA
ncbi:hypothetical protein scyTo_0011172 [Scyliorhinus torazame]|uniref:DJ-1/PfpI domain-containing protein n=1 Tax=Scyliorhinus torazame TaxID=75743 RepID=A0A401NIE8_SCYTO|nr:hypothetical protein [Scyliorhinus torazame]